jgi:hypothetical protein
MNHLSDSQLNEYLDNLLDAPTRRKADAHLRSCEECHLRLAELQLVLSAIEDLHEVKLSHDLTSSVMVHLPQSQRLWTRTFVAQLGAALGVLFWLSMQVAKFVTPSNFHFPQFVIPAFQFAMPNFQLSNLYSWFSTPHSLFTILHFPSSIFNLRIFDFPNFQPFDFAQDRLSTFNIIFITISVFALWLVGNLSLLHYHSGDQK